MKIYTIVGGVNGVGKSSLSGVLRHQLPDMGLIIDPDTIAAKESCDRLLPESLLSPVWKTACKKVSTFRRKPHFPAGVPFAPYSRQEKKITTFGCIMWA